MADYPNIDLPHREPSASRRQAAHSLHEWFVALCEAGFSADRAERMVTRKIPVIKS